MLLICYDIFLCSSTLEPRQLLQRGLLLDTYMAHVFRLLVDIYQEQLWMSRTCCMPDIR